MPDDSSPKKEPTHTAHGRQIVAQPIIKKVCTGCGREFEVAIRQTERPNCAGALREV